MLVHEPDQASGPMCSAGSGLARAGAVCSAHMRALGASVVYGTAPEAAKMDSVWCVSWAGSVQT